MPASTQPYSARTVQKAFGSRSRATLLSLSTAYLGQALDNDVALLRLQDAALDQRLGVRLAALRERVGIITPQGADVRV